MIVYVAHAKHRDMTWTVHVQEFREGGGPFPVGGPVTFHRNMRCRLYTFAFRVVISETCKGWAWSIDAAVLSYIGKGGAQ